jgi:hypothetical protein
MDAGRSGSDAPYEAPMRPALLSFPSFFSLAILAAACSSASSDAASAGDSLVVNPAGDEHESTLVVRLPNDACLPGAACPKVLGTAPTVYVDGTQVAIGASTLLSPGTHNVAVNNLGAQVTTNPGDNITLTLPIVQAACTNAAPPGVPATAFGKTLNLTNAPCPTTLQGSSVGVNGPRSIDGQIYYDSGCSSNDTFAQRIANASPSAMCAQSTSYYPNASYNYKAAGGGCVTIGYGMAACLSAVSLVTLGPGSTLLSPSWQAYPPGTLSASVNGAAQTLAINAGDEVPFAISLPVIGTVPATFATNVTFLSAKSNPDAGVATITSSCAGERSYSFPASVAAAAPPAALALAAFVSAGCNYTLSAGGRTVALSQATTNNVSVNRLDVNDVTLKRDDGSTFTVKGTWTLNFGGVQVAGPFNTGTGIDVLPGTYQLTVSYTDLNGRQTSSQSVSL